MYKTASNRHMGYNEKIKKTHDTPITQITAINKTSSVTVKQLQSLVNSDQGNSLTKQ